MVGSHIVLLINIMIAVAFASAFAAIHFYDRRQDAARFFALAYGAGAVEATFYLLHVATGLVLFRTIGSVFLAGLLVALVTGLARLYRQPVRPPLLAGLVATILFLGVWSTLVDETMLVRYAIFPIPLGLMMLTGAAMVWRAGPARRTDRVLLGLLILNSLQFLLRPVAFLAFVHGAMPPGEIPGSSFAIVVHTTISFCAVATALGLLTIICLRIKEEVEERAVRDPLSGLLNRRGFEERAHALIAEAAAGERALCLVLADIDRFKSINDRYGHAFGDEVIAAMGAMLAAHAGEPFCVGRIGGEEFAVILRDADADRALAIAERMRERFAARRFTIGEDGVAFTASFGVTGIGPGDTLVDALRRADIALYEAKDAGRDGARATSAPVRAAA